MMNNKIYLSIVIPAYNEEKIIEETLKSVLRFLKNKKYTWEVVVVDDGSTDKTSKIVENVINGNKRHPELGSGSEREKRDLSTSLKMTKKKIPKRVSSSLSISLNRRNDEDLRLISLDKNMGKGAALRKGFKEAKGEYQIFTDADLSVDVNYIDRFLEEFKKGSDVVIASRRVKGAKIEVHQPWHREKMGQVYTLLTSIVMSMNLKDYTCGMKGFTKEASKKVFSAALVNRWAYDSEILYLSKKYGFKIKQTPIVWKNRGETRVRLTNVIFESFRDLVSIRVNDLQGKYNIDK